MWVPWMLPPWVWQYFQFLNCFLGGTVATATAEGHAAALIVLATATIASVESISAAIVVVGGATTAATGLSLLALVLLLATPAVMRLTILVVLPWVLKHASRGLAANNVAEHLNHSIEGGAAIV